MDKYTMAAKLTASNDDKFDLNEEYEKDPKVECPVLISVSVYLPADIAYVIPGNRTLDEIKEAINFIGQATCAEISNWPAEGNIGVAPPTTFEIRKMSKTLGDAVLAGKAGELVAEIEGVEGDNVTVQSIPVSTSIN